MPSSKNYVRNYAQENKYKAQPAQIKAREERNKARADAIRKGQVRKGDNLQVDHTRPLGMGGTNSPSNRRVVSASANESFKRNSLGAIVSQISTKERKKRK